MPLKTLIKKNPRAGSFQGALGFTLIELMVTIAIAGVLMVVAVPSFLSFQRNAQLSDAVSNLMLATNTARANSMKQGFNTYLVPNNAAIGWSSGWFVYSDSNWNDTFELGNDEVILRHDPVGSSVTITTPGLSTLAEGYLLFNGSGYPRTKLGAFGGATMVMKNASRTNSIILDPAGRLRSCKTDPPC